MHDAAAQFASDLQIAAIRTQKRLRFATLLALLIAILLWRTQWPSLWPGLGILLFAQLAVAVLLLYRNSKTSSYLRRLSDGDLSTTAALAWFDEEQSFLQRLALLENALRISGFAVLAYGFWAPTHALWITLILGILYPAILCFGLGRGTNKRTINLLKAQQSKFRRG